MKEIQNPKKNFARSSDARIKKPRDPEMKNRKVAEKQSATFSYVDPVDFTQITQVSGMISDSEAESVVIQGSSQDLSSNPEIFLPTDEPPVEAHVDASSTDQIQSISDLSAFVQSSRAEINELRKLIYPVDTCEENIDGVITAKFRIMLLSFILWAAVLAAFVVFFSSGEEIAYYGPLPT